VEIGAILATGNTAAVESGNPAVAALRDLPHDVARQIETVESWHDVDGLSAVLFDGSADALRNLNKAAAERNGAIVQVHVPVEDPSGERHYPLSRLLEERSISTNTAAAGGNASLMMIG
ncbi:MAG: hypothetical protein AB7K04_13260, partial [Pseudorhodoplanes sp.]